MNPEDRLRALNDSDRWTVNAIQPRENPFGSVAPARRRQSWRMIFAEIGVVVAVGAIIFGVIALQNGSEDNLSNPIPLPDVTSSTPTPTPSPTVTPPVETPTPPPVPPAAPEKKKIVLTTTALEVRTPSGEVVDEFPFRAADWEQGTTAVTAALSELFDEEPTITEEDGGFKWGTYFDYTWDGVVAHIRGDIYGGDWVFEIDATSREVNGILIETTDGFAIGTPISELAQPGMDLEGESSATQDSGYQLIDVVELQGAEAEAEKDYRAGDKRAARGVLVFWDAGKLTEINAPAQNYGD